MSPASKPCTNTTFIRLPRKVFVCEFNLIKLITDTNCKSSLNQDKFHQFLDSTQDLLQSHARAPTYSVTVSRIQHAASGPRLLRQPCQLCFGGLSSLRCSACFISDKRRLKVFWRFWVRADYFLKSRCGMALPLSSDNNPAFAYTASLSRVSTMSRLRIVN